MFCSLRQGLCQLQQHKKQFSIYFYGPSLKAFHYRNITEDEVSKHHGQFICLFCWDGINRDWKEMLFQLRGLRSRVKPCLLRAPHFSFPKGFLETDWAETSLLVLLYRGVLGSEMGFFSQSGKFREDLAK